ncbi:hypothetical protein [Ruixingdingia sedimenti]|uniref:Strictosidine synthase n=1 Tax=Ruixingdingia sedimenti TaxID=3073604 RepID=A0ABU1F9K2_9RHOB|nr:hypothetical protein [Xinfangfangia sp. LG-4]MDR5653303.1 hypothetical protein [Xinfangfangia sp. LG-4]
MIQAIRSLWDDFRGAGAAALSVPSMDGAFRPNQNLEEAPVALACDRPDNVTVAGGRVYLSSGARVLALTGPGTAEVAADGDAPVTAMAGLPDGTLAVARSGAGAVLAVDPQGRGAGRIYGAGMADITAMAFADDGALALAVGSARFRAADWRHDLMHPGQSGSVWLAPLSGAAPQRLAEGLRYAGGIAPAGPGRFVVSETWASRLVTVGQGAPAPVLSGLPAYPWRIAPATGGGCWVAFLAPRNQLIELVLRDRAFRGRMVAELDPEYWIAPMLRPSDQPLDPMLKGVQRVSGSEPKPWGSSLSWGLVARIGADFVPDFSHHSRANGKRHGFTSAAEHDGRLLATSHCGFVVSLPVDQR